MAFSKKKEEKHYDKVESVEIIRAISNKYGTYFDMRLNGVRINDCAVRETKKGGYFIALPQKKGKDTDQYWSIVMFYFSPEDQDNILQLVQDRLNEDEQ